MNIASLFRFDIKLYNFLLTPKVIITIINNLPAIKAAYKNRSLKNTQTGRILYVCGNGPSLNKVNMKDIKEDYLVVNDFYKFTNKDMDHPPKYYMILDESFLDHENEDRLTSIIHPGFDTTYILNGLFLNRFKLHNIENNAVFFCPWGKLYNSKKEFRFDKVHGRTWNVVSEAILFGIYLGYSEIRLLGCDYSVFATNAHFYSGTNSRPHLLEMLYKYCFTTEVHYEIKKYADKKNVKIINLTKDTLLDAYDIDQYSNY